MPKNGDLKVWWIPQIPMKAFEVPVKNIEEAKLILNTLADYDIFQFENNVKGDYCNAGGLLIYDADCLDDEGNCWTEWCNDDGDEINDIMRNEDE